MPPKLEGLTETEQRGETLFQQNCAFCHAADGTARNWIGSFMEPHPRNLTKSAAMDSMTRTRLRTVIRDGSARHFHAGVEIGIVGTAGGGCHRLCGARLPSPSAIIIMLKIYNTLARDKQEFVPIVPGKVGMYVCGMTVYDYCHLGHARVLVVFDMVYRWLKASGFEVNYVRNITDIDDKIIKRAAENGESIHALTAALHRLRCTRMPMRWACSTPTMNRAPRNTCRRCWR